jgi:hypothetical protein
VGRLLEMARRKLVAPEHRVGVAQAAGRAPEGRVGGERRLQALDGGLVALEQHEETGAVEGRPLLEAHGCGSKMNQVQGQE